MKYFGKTVKKLRQELNLTKEEFCQDETELSVRQLTRIEGGISTPTLTKIEFIAQRLGVTIGTLTDCSTDLPPRYEELKFLLLRTQTYLEPNHIRQCEEYLDDIFENYYDDLPEEEQIVIEALRSRIDYALDTKNTLAIHILGDYLTQIRKKCNYHINDLILLNTYLIFLSQQTESLTTEQVHELKHIITRLLQAGSGLPSSQLFVLISTISAAASNCLIRKDLSNLLRLLERMEKLMQQAQDFQRMPIFHLLTWKYNLLMNDPEQAKKHYDSACLFAKLTYNDYLVERLVNEWEKDSIKQN